MSTQRRRVLENTEAGIPIDKISDGVYIEDIDGKAYKADDWQSGYTANSVVVASGDVKFRIALTNAYDCMRIGFDSLAEVDRYMKEITAATAAKEDYDGAGNTAKISKAIYNCTNCAATYCNMFTFPDGSNKGFLPSLGQLNLAYQNKAAVDAALAACGGAAMYAYEYWSSTYHNKNSISDDRSFWLLNWGDGTAEHHYLTYCRNVRPFADIS